MDRTTGGGDAMTPFQRLLRRRTFIVNKKLQHQLLLRTMWHLVLVLLITVTVLFVPLMIQLSTSNPQSDSALQAAHHLLYLHGRFWPTMALVCTLVGLDALRTSHRIAGPILRFQRALADVRSGRPPRLIVLRKEDFFQDECAQLNEAILEARFRAEERQRVEAGLEESVRRVRSLRVADQTSLSPEHRMALEELLTYLEARSDRTERAA